MAYCTVAEVSADTGEGWLNDAESSIITNIITIADLKVKALVMKSGLTPPATDDILKVASIEFCKAELIRRGRFTGSISKAGANPDTYDSVNKAIKMHTDMAKEFVEAYVMGTASADVSPSDTDGQPRADLTADNFKLDQSTNSGFG